MRFAKATALVFVLLLVGGISLAQTANGSAKKSSASSEDISGMYSFLRDGEFVQITVEPGSEGNQPGKPIPVSGFLSRLGESDSDRDLVLDQFFTKGALDRDNLSFTTKTVHAVSYEFSGKVQRGEAKSRADEGYFVLKGTLKQNTVGDDKKVSTKSREITMKSFPDIDDTQAQK